MTTISSRARIAPALAGNDVSGCPARARNAGARFVNPHLEVEGVADQLVLLVGDVITLAGHTDTAAGQDTLGNELLVGTVGRRVGCAEEDLEVLGGHGLLGALERDAAVQNRVLQVVVRSRLHLSGGLVPDLMRIAVELDPGRFPPDEHRSAASAGLLWASPCSALAYRLKSFADAVLGLVSSSPRTLRVLTSLPGPSTRAKPVFPSKKPLAEQLAVRAGLHSGRAHPACRSAASVWSRPHNRAAGTGPRQSAG